MERALLFVMLALTLLQSPAQAKPLATLRLTAVSGVCGLIIGVYGTSELLRGQKWLRSGDKIGAMARQLPDQERAKAYEAAVRDYTVAGKHLGNASLFLATSGGLLLIGAASAALELRRLRHPPWQFYLRITDIPEDVSVLLNGQEQTPHEGQVRLALNHLDFYRLEFSSGDKLLSPRQSLPMYMTQGSSNEIVVTLSELLE